MKEGGGGSSTNNNNVDNKNLDANSIKAEMEADHLAPTEQYHPSTIITNPSYQSPNDSPISSLDSDSKGTCLST